MLYSTEVDIKLGDIPLPAYIDKDRLLQDAADEIDSFIGFVYDTPVNMQDDSPVIRPARLLLKRISTALVTGRLVLEIAASGEDVALHAYGVRLLNEAHVALEQIRTGTIHLDGAELLPNEDGTDNPTGPLIANVDSDSLVEAFYDRFSFVGPAGVSWLR